MLIKDYQPKCLERHMGMWAIETGWLSEMIYSVEHGLIEMRNESELEDYGIGAKSVYDGKVRIIPVMGAIFKGFSKYGGTSSIAVRREIKQAVQDSNTDAIVLHMETPGGVVSGIDELAQEVNRATATKPVLVHADDLLASAGVWVASQATSIAANRAAEVGSIGTITTLIDSSEAAESEGIKVHVITTADFKGTGVPGAPITDEQLAEVRRRVEAKNAMFMDAVMSGRNMNGEQLSRVNDGRLFGANEAIGLGLIDKVQSFEETIADALAIVQENERKAQSRTMNARSLIRKIK